MVQRSGTAIVAVVTVVAVTLSLVVTAVGVVAAAKLEYADSLEESFLDDDIVNDEQCAIRCALSYK